MFNVVRSVLLAVLVSVTLSQPAQASQQASSPATKIVITDFRHDISGPMVMGAGGIDVYRATYEYTPAVTNETGSYLDSVSFAVRFAGHVPHADAVKYLSAKVRFTAGDSDYVMTMNLRRGARLFQFVEDHWDRVEATGVSFVSATDENGYMAAQMDPARFAGEPLQGLTTTLWYSERAYDRVPAASEPLRVQ